MIAFFLSLLVLLLYAAIVILLIRVVFYFFTRIFGQPVPGEIANLIYAIIALVFIIWLVQSVVASSPIPAPWNWNALKR